MKIDIFPHILPKNYAERLCQKAKGGASQLPGWVHRMDGPLGNIDVRLRFLDRYPDVRQVVTVSVMDTW